VLALDDIKVIRLIEAAIKAREAAYAPYSGFRVGAALLTADGAVFGGCNIENAAFSPSNCAERTAFFTAVACGFKDFAAIAIVGGADSKGDLADNCYPCGVCRQVMAEFCKEDFRIIIAQSPQNWRIFTLGELLPHGFGPANL
jgi:cytidine deaminase